MNEEDVIYDHPTDLLHPSETLSKTLMSLENISGEFDVVIVGCPTRPSIGEEMDKYIEEIISRIDLSFTPKYFGFKEYNTLKTLVSQELSVDFSNLVSNKGYGNIRNLCLILPHLLESDIVMLIDDDELIIDPFFVKKASEYIGTQFEEKLLGLIVGFYKNTDESIFLDESKTPWWNIVWEKEKYMNKAFQIIADQSNDRLVDSPFAFGGNMVIHRSCWESVPFDPFIARGEDMDYLRNVKYFGFEVKLDRDLWIIHSPPNVSRPEKLKFRQDIHRFLYSKYKLERMQLDPQTFDPYPGYFLKQTEGKVILTELLFHIFHNRNKFLEITDINQFINEIQNLGFYFNEVQDECRRNSGTYIEFQKRWKNLMIKLSLLKISSSIVTQFKT